MVRAGGLKTHSAPAVDRNLKTWFDGGTAGRPFLVGHAHHLGDMEQVEDLAALEEVLAYGTLESQDFRSARGVMFFI